MSTPRITWAGEGVGQQDQAQDDEGHADGDEQGAGRPVHALVLGRPGRRRYRNGVLGYERASRASSGPASLTGRTGHQRHPVRVNVPAHYVPGMGPAQAIDWRRHPADLARLVAVALVLGVVLVLTAVEPGALTDLSDDLVDAVRRLPASARGLVAGTLQVVAFVLPVVGVVWAAIRRSWLRLWPQALVALVVAAVPMALLTNWLHRAAPPQVRATAEADSWLTGQAFPLSAAYLAALSAVVTAVSPLLHRRWRRTLWFLVGLAAVPAHDDGGGRPRQRGHRRLDGRGRRLLASPRAGAPARRLDPEAILQALGRAGLALDHLEALPSDGRPVFVGRQARQGSPGPRQLRRPGRGAMPTSSTARPGGGCGSRGSRIRWLRFDRLPRCVTRRWPATWLPGPGLRRPASSPWGRPPMTTACLPLDLIEGSPLVELPPEVVTDDLLHLVWGEVGRLHRRRVAHRRLSMDQVLVGGDGAPTLIGLRGPSTRGHRRPAGGGRRRPAGGDGGRGGRRAGRGRRCRSGARGPAGRRPAARSAPRPLGRDPTSGPRRQGPRQPRSGTACRPPRVPRRWSCSPSSASAGARRRAPSASSSSSSSRAGLHQQLELDRQRPVGGRLESPPGDGRPGDAAVPRPEG